MTTQSQDTERHRRMGCRAHPNEYDPGCYWCRLRMREVARETKPARKKEKKP